jgi:hypothetical protein
MEVALTAGTNAASQMRRAAQDGYGSNPEKLNESKCFPLFTQQRTSPRYFGMFVSCHERKSPPE